MESNLTGRLPIIFGNQSFKVIGNEVKFFKQLNEKDWLVGKIDVIAEARINNKPLILLGDYKTSAGHDRWQYCVYHFLTHDHEWWLEHTGNRQPEHFWYFMFDKFTGKTSIEIIKLTYPETKEQWALPDETTYTTGANWILTILEEIKQELNMN